MGARLGFGVACYPLDQRARREYEQRRLSEPAAAHPAPEVATRPARPDEIPTGAVRIRRAADEAGWLTGAWYARGTSMYANGKPGKVVEQATITGTRDDALFVAWWTDSAFDTAVSSTTSTGLRRVNARELRRIIAGLAGAVAA